MSDRPLLDGLAEVAREERALEREDPELAARLKGELSAAAAAELEARIDPLDAELFQPISAERKAELMNKVRAQLAASSPAASAAPAENVVSLSRRRWPLFLAIAASALIAVFGARRFLSSPAASALPAYAMSISSGEQQQRAHVPPEQIPVFAPNTTLQLILRPAREVEGAVELRGFLKRGERTIAWSPPSTVDPGGSIIIEGQASELLRVEPGEWTIVIVLGRPDQAPSVTLEQKIVVAD